MYAFRARLSLSLLSLISLSLSFFFSSLYPLTFLSSPTRKRRSMPLVMGSISTRGRQSEVDAKPADEGDWLERLRGKIFEHTLQMFALVLDIA